jgi:hypothetical protein
MSQRSDCLWRLLGALIVVTLVCSPFSAAGKGFAPFSFESAMNGQSGSLLIDDFSKDSGASSFGTQWRMFTDQVMGGVSTGEWNYETIDGRRCLRLRGDVSLANNGGFVQIGLPLTRDGWPFDASSFKGVRLWARGNGEAYSIHLRSSDSRLPWQYYGAEFVANGSWQKFDVPFSAFVPEGLEAELRPDRLVRIAVVAIKKEFKADIAVARLEFYR